MIRLIGIVAILIPFWSAAFSAEPRAETETTASSIRIFVVVTSEAEDEMARRLASAVIKEIDNDARFQLVERRSRALNISLPARVGWQRRLDWSEISYQVRLNSTNGHSRVATGYCWNWNLKACAKQIIDSAVQFETN